MKLRTLCAAGRYALAFGLLAWVVGSYWDPATGGGLRLAFEEPAVPGASVRTGAYAGAVALCALAVILTLVRWHLLARVQGVPLRIVDTARVGAAGLFLNTLLPGALGGDVSKLLVLSRYNLDRAAAVAITAADRVIGLWTLFAFAAAAGTVGLGAGYFTGPARSAAAWVTATAGVGAIAGAAWWAGLRRGGYNAPRAAVRPVEGARTDGRFGAFWHALRSYRCHPDGVLAAVGLSAASHLAVVLGFLLCAHALATADGPQLALTHFVDHLLIVPVFLLARAVPLCPGGVGLGELAVADAYRRFGYQPASGVVASLVYRSVYWLMGLAGFFVYSLLRHDNQTGAAGPADCPPLH